MTGLLFISNLFNVMLVLGKIPSEWLISTIIRPSKNSNASQCGDYSMMSLMSHVHKIFLKIIHIRIHNKCKDPIKDMKFCFPNGVGTGEALFPLYVLTHICLDINVHDYACFIECRQAIYCVQHQMLTEFLRTTGIDTKDLPVITEIFLYLHKLICMLYF